MYEIKLANRAIIRKQLKIQGKYVDYEVDNDGNVFRKSTGKKLTSKYLNTAGYKVVVIGFGPDGKKTFKNMLVHRLVASTFIPNPENKECVNHIDGNKLNNEVENLEWLSGKENMKHARFSGLWNPDGEHNGNAKYTDEQVEETCKLLQEAKLTNKEIAKITGLSSAMVSMIKIGKVRTIQSKKYKWDTIPFGERKGENHNMAKINEKIVKEICELLAYGYTSTKVAKLLKNKYPDVTKAIVQNIKYRKVWNNISKDYEWGNPISNKIYEVC